MPADSQLKALNLVRLSWFLSSKNQDYKLAELTDMFLLSFFSPNIQDRGLIAPEFYPACSVSRYEAPSKLVNYFMVAVDDAASQLAFKKSIELTRKLH
jgi:hypothetical protein